MYTETNRNKNKQILVADDDPAICDALKIMLEDEGYVVETLLSGQPLYDLRDDLPDLIILDISMSGQDGRDICRYLKQNKRTENVLIIMISAGGNIGRSAREAGADDYISKPFGMYDLLEKVARHLSGRTAGAAHIVSESDKEG